VSLLMSTSDGPNDYIHHGTVEYSLDGQQWQPLGNGSTAELVVHAPPGTLARFVRYRATADNDGDWLAVREFAVAVDG
jgi:hyaluronoglucosaminidase